MANSRAAKSKPGTPPGTVHGTLHGTLEEAIQRLAQTSLRRTKPREILLEALVKKHGPFTAEELAAAVVPRGKGKPLDLVTVYRSLAAFEKAGLVRRCEFGDGYSRYEFQCEHEHHHHIICRLCRRTENLDDCSIQELEKAVLRKGYAEITHTLEFFGICGACKTKGGNPR